MSKAFEISRVIAFVMDLLSNVSWLLCVMTVKTSAVEQDSEFILFVTQELVTVQVIGNSTVDDSPQKFADDNEEADRAIL